MTPGDRNPEPSSRPETTTRPTAAPSAAVTPIDALRRGPAAIERLLGEMLGRGASDLHLSSGQEPRLRIDGELAPLAGHGRPSADALEAALLALAPAPNREEFRARNDTDFGLELAGRARFRANYFRDRLGISAVFRHIPTEIPSFEQLGLPESLLALTSLTQGLVLVTGATGSGKSTTLAALIDLINRGRPDHIITVEDPIEFVHPSRRCLVHHREIGTHTESFASALRAALREDPDVVMVGELRDLETAAIAIQTAETGHLVFGTLHTTSAPATVERLIDQFPEGQQAQIRTLLADTLKAVVTQVLVRKIGGGRVAAHEVLLVNGAVSNLIREGKVFQIPSVMQTARGQGMQTLDDALLALVAAGTVEADDALLKANDKKAFAARLRAGGSNVASMETRTAAAAG